MKSVLERVNYVCKTVRNKNTECYSFKKLIGAVRKEFREQDLDIKFITKKDKTLEVSQFYVMAYYDSEDDFNQETAIEVHVYHFFQDKDRFDNNNKAEFLIQIFDAVVHEYRHQHQSRRRGYENFSPHETEPYETYLSDSDEVDAYAFSIAIELLRSMPVERAKRYLTKITTLSKMKMHGSLVSPSLNSYVHYFQKKPLIKRIAKKIYKNLDEIDSRDIFK
jgi:hypothetical protein